MKYTNILKTNLMRAVMTLALIVTCAAAWAQTTQSVSYIDANGQSQTVNATVLTGNEYTLGSYNQTTWYVVNSNITHNGLIGFEGHVNIILADGKTMTVNGGNQNAFSNSYNNNSHSLTIYGQSGQSGTLTCSSTTDAIYSYAASFIVNSGIVNVTGGSGSSKGICSKNVTINGGTVNANGYYGIYADSGGNIAINGGKVTANGTWGIYGKCNVTLSWKNDTDRIYASQYYGYTISIAEGKYFKDASGNIYCGNVSASSINNKTLQPATQTEYIQACLGTGNDGTAAHPYTINDANGWNAFCLALQDKDTWNGFSGKIVKLGANISVSRMAGSQYRDFAGTFDGYGKTLTFTSTENTDRVAPFSYITNNTPEGGTTLSPAVIRNLNVVANITTGGQYASGMVGQAWGELTIEHCTVSGTITTSNQFAGGIIGYASSTPLNITDCRSSVTIISSVNGDGTHGGIAARVASSTTVALNISGCLFNGKIVTTNGTTHCGGFVGHNDHSNGANVSISNSLYAPASDANTVSAGCATFVRDAATITNCYYTTVLGTVQGKERHSITADENVTVAFSGTANEYQTSGITAYKDGNTQLPGLKYGDVLYAGNGDEVSLTLGYTLPEGYVFNGYTVSPDGATLTSSGNAYTLTMPNANVTISADFYYCPKPTLALVDNSITAHGATVSWTGSSDSYILEYAEGNSPSIWTTVSSNATSPYTFDNLNPATTYSVRVTGNCGSDGNNHPSDVVSFTTDCLDFIVVDAAHPFTEDFEGEDFPPLCWENIASGYHRWSRQSNDHDSGSASAYSGFYGPIYLVMPDIQLPSNGTAQLTFWSYYDWLGFYDKSSVVLLDGDTETELWTPDINELEEYNWYETTIDLTAYMGQTISLAFKYEGDDAHEWFVDDVVVTATASIFTKDIEAHGEGNGGWYLIASPLDDPTDATAVTNLVNSETPDDFDLYRFNQAVESEWENWKQEGDHYHFNLESGRGYLYANSQDVTLVFTGTPYEGEGEVTLNKTEDEGIDFPGWNLVGNPFAETAIIDREGFYRMNEEGSEIEVAETNTIAPMEGIFVLADEDGETLTFSTQEPSKGHIQKCEPKQIVINLSRNGGSVIDRAIVRFDGPSTSSGTGGTLPKFQMNPNHTKVYIPQDGNDYAVVRSEGVGEMPVNFKAEKNGTYTLSFNAEDVEFSYLHLIDNLTGNDVDLLSAGDCGAAPAVTAEGTSYTFTAKTTDYASRFRLVFVCGDANGDNDSFAFYSNGNWIIANEGEATLQVIDITGRILSSETVNGSVSKSINQPAGVYMIRLINGETVKVQKVVVR